MSENNSEFENNSGEGMQTKAEETNQDEEQSSTSQQALKQLNQLSGSGGGTIKATTIATSAIQKIDPKLAISGGTKIVYIKNANGAPSTIRIGNQIIHSTSGQSVVSANTAINATNASNPNIRKVQLVPLKNKNVVTTNNAQRIVLKSATLLASGAKSSAGGTGPRTITMSQAQQMGLIATSINKSNPSSSTNTTPLTTKTILLPATSNAGTTQIAVKNSQPTILNKGVKPLQSKVLIQSDSADSEAKPKTIATQNLLKVTGQQVRAVNVPGKGLQYVRVLSTLPASGSTVNSTATKVVNGGRQQQQVIQQRKLLPQQQTAPTGSAVAKQFITRKLEVLPVGSGTKIIKKEPILNQTNKVPGTYLLNNVQKNVVTSSIDIKPIASNQNESFEITETKAEPSSPTESQKKFVQRTYSASNERRSKSPDGNHSNVLYSTLKLPSPDPMEGIRRKHCNCTKSQCLKLYCDCFANGEFCSNCNCKECFNTLEKEDERQKAIKMCLERNPHAFKPKIGKARDQSDTLRRHTKGCNCKRSGCLKNYCECYEAKIVCSANCKCLGCRNIDDHMDNNDRDGSQYDSNQTVKRAYNQLDEKIRNEPVVPPKKPCNFITPDVIEATVQCIIAQADDCTKNSCDTKTSERKILEEFGRCLVEIIEFSKKNNDNPDD